MLVLIGVLLDHVGADRVQIGFIRVLQQIAVGYLVAFLVLGVRWPCRRSSSRSSS